MIKLWRITIIGIVVVILVLFWVFVIGISSNQPGSYFNKGHNAVWLEKNWSTGVKTDKEIEELVKHLTKMEIDTVFVHAGPLDEKGKIENTRYKELNAFFEIAKSYNENIQYQAWLGQLRQKIDLDNYKIRLEIAQTCMTLTDVIGFDGIHFDIEPVWDNDIAFIETLKETRELISEDKKISVALAEYIPQSVIWLTESFKKFENYNTEVNYKNVAEYADQVVVMVYDTSINKEWLYRWLVKEQTIWLTSLLDGTEVFVGIPAYEENGDAFNPKIENVANALKGMIAGLNNLRSDVDNFAGVAIYRYEEVDESEWTQYEELLLK